MSETSKRVIVTVIGEDRIGIIAAVARILADADVNIVDISQTIMQEFFVMIMMADMKRASLPFEELKRHLNAKGEELGVRIAVDDFGTGYSSLAYLQQFPVDCLKIDRAFTHAITTSPESKALIRTLVQLGRDLGLKTLAEGVETTGEMDHLRNENVDEAQGFLLSRPLESEALETQILIPSRAAHEALKQP